MQSADLTLRIPQSMYPPIFEKGSAEEVVCREETLSWEFDRESGTVRFLSVFVGDSEAINKLAREESTIERFETTRIDNDTFYGYVEIGMAKLDGALLDLFDFSRLVVVPPVVFTGTDRVQLTVLGEQGALRRVFERVPDAFDVEVERISEHRRRAETLAGRLTARQFEALEVAHEIGYYEVPRTGSLADVAAELDCSESAASRLLRSGESAIVGAAIGRESTKPTA